MDILSYLIGYNAGYAAPNPSLGEDAAEAGDIVAGKKAYTADNAELEGTLV